MPLTTVYSQPLALGYRAAYCSKAYFFQVGSLLLTLVCPLLVAYRSQGFWVKTNTYREQPQVAFTHDFLFLLKTADPTQYLVWSSFAQLNRFEEAKLRVPLIRSQTQDGNRDRVADAVELSARFPLAAGEKVQGLHVLLFFDYRLDLYSRFRTTGFVSLESESLLVGREFSASADLTLQQRLPLWYRGTDTRFADHPINFTNVDGSTRAAKAEDFRLPRLLAAYAERNVTLGLANVLSHWTPAAYDLAEPFMVKIRIAFPEQSIQYYAGFWELIKWGWIQYLAILPIFILVVGAIRRFVFQNRLVKAVPQKLQLYQ